MVAKFKYARGGSRALATPHLPVQLTKAMCDVAEVGDGGQDDPERVLLLLCELHELHGAAHPAPVLQRGRDLHLLLHQAMNA